MTPETISQKNEKEKEKSKEIRTKLGTTLRNYTSGQAHKKN